MPARDHSEFDVRVEGDRVLHVYADAAPDPTRLPVFWHHGTPGTGAPPRPLLEAADRLGMRWVSLDRPGYGGSAPAPHRSVASVARDVEAVADALALDRFAVMGYSGGGSFALGCAALLGDRVTAAATLAAVAPFPPDDPAWFAGMEPSTAAVLAAAVDGRASRAAVEESGSIAEPPFTADDVAFFDGPWGWLGEVAQSAAEHQKGGEIDDDVAYTRPWDCELADIHAPVLLLHGTHDRIIPAHHATRIAAACPRAEVRLSGGDTHFTVLSQAESALEWLHLVAR